MSLQLVAVALFSAIAGAGVGLWWGRHLWGPKWFDTSEGIDRRFQKAMRKGF
jgi:hypothetical protein